MSTATQGPSLHVRRLNPVSREIRLLEPRRLLVTDDAIRFDIRTVSLDHEPTFTALSYEWRLGGVSLPVQLSIRVNGHDIHVTEDLFVALYTILRLPAHNRMRLSRLRIDATTRDIYTAADSVIVWLGPLPLRRHTRILAAKLIKEAETVGLSANDPTSMADPAVDRS